MAVIQSSKKIRVYRSLYQINHAFNVIVQGVRELEDSGMFPVVKMRVLKGLTRELQSQISHDVTDKMHSVEDDEMLQWGKTRIAWENHLDPDRPR